MIINGVKMACEACIRGHRVSGCNHQDRKLLPIAKKGRPVSQCNHCRHMRKSRAAHVKCDCGERIAAAKEAAKLGGKPAGSLADVVSASATTEVGDSKSVPTCPCTHGGRCTCASKKEPQHLDAVPEFSAPPTSCGSAVSSVMPSIRATIPEGRSKPRLSMTHSESSLTTFANGHHKPTHKHHSSIHGSSPYSIPTIGHSGHSFGPHEGTHKTGTSSSSSSTSTPAASQKPRRIKSEQSSPDLRTYAALPLPNTSITPLELTPSPAPTRNAGRMQTGLSVNTQNFPAMGSYGSQELLPSADSEGYQFSAGLFPPASAGWPPSFHQYDSTSSFDEQLAAEPASAAADGNYVDLETFMQMNSLPALTNSTSGDEPEGISPPYVQGFFSSSSSNQSESENNCGLSASSSFISQPQVGSGFEDGDLDRLLVTSLPPQQSQPQAEMSPFGPLTAASVGDIFADGAGLDLGTFGPDFSAPEISPQKTVEAVIPPTTTAEDGDFLWMAPWSAGTGEF